MPPSPIFALVPQMSSKFFRLTRRTILNPGYVRLKSEHSSLDPLSDSPLYQITRARDFSSLPFFPPIPMILVVRTVSILLARSQCSLIPPFFSLVKFTLFKYIEPSFPVCLRLLYRQTFESRVARDIFKFPITDVAIPLNERPPGTVFKPLFLFVAQHYPPSL